MMLLLLFIIPMFTHFNKPEPPQYDFQGITMALGNPDATSEKEPASQSAPSVEPAPQQPKPKKSIPVAPAKREEVNNKPAKKTAIVSKTVAEVAPVVAQKSKAKEVKRKEDIEAAKKSKQKAELAKKKAQEVAERAAKEKEEAEKKQKAAEEAAQKAAQKNAAKNKFKSMLSSSDGTGESDKKGNPLGSPNATALEGMTTGKGTAGKGMGDRSLLYSPEISDNTQRTGKVVVEICINGSGNVTSAKYTQKGSTTTDSHLIAVATQNAKKFKFSKSNTSDQCGEVVVEFKLQ